MCIGRFWYCSVTGAIESAYHRKFRVMRELSEQQLIDCSYKPNGPWGCGGGVPFQAFDYLKYNELTSDKEYPYIGVRRPCRRHTPQSLVVRRFVRMRMVSIYWFSPACKIYIHSVMRILNNDNRLMKITWRTCLHMRAQLAYHSPLEKICCFTAEEFTIIPRVKIG